MKAALKRTFAKKGIRPSYANYSAIGHLVLKNADGTVLADVESSLIYEFVFMGLEYKKYMEKE